MKRETVQTYFGEILMLGRRLLPLFALALDLDEDWFEDKTKTNFAMQRLLYYPPLEGRPADDQPGIGVSFFISSRSILTATGAP